MILQYWDHCLKGKKDLFLTNRKTNQILLENMLQKFFPVYNDSSRYSAISKTECSRWYA